MRIYDELVKLGVNGKYLTNLNISDTQMIDLLTHLESLQQKPIKDYNDLLKIIRDVSSDISYAAIGLHGKILYSNGEPKCDWCALANSRILNCKTEELKMGKYFGSVDFFNGFIRFVIPCVKTICIVEIKFNVELMVDIIRIKSILESIEVKKCKYCSQKYLILDEDMHISTECKVAKNNIQHVKI